MTDEQKSIRQTNNLETDKLERIIPDKHQRDTFQRLLEHLDSDTAAMVALKGHLVIEEKITSAIEKFVFHPEYVDDARLAFAQKLAFARSLSLDEEKNSMWELLSRLNRLRNTLSHSLDDARRAGAMNAIKDAYRNERNGRLEDWEEANETSLLLSVVSLCLGFLDGFEQEVERFREHVGLMDKIVNPHRRPAPTDEPQP